MGDKNNAGPPVIHFSSSVDTEHAGTLSTTSCNIYPALPLENPILLPGCNGISAGSPMTPSAPRRMGHFSALPRVNLPNIRVPEMMDISSYIPTIKPPAFLKDVYSFPIQVGDHVNREVRSIGNNINKIIDRGDVFLQKPPPLPEFTNWSIFGALFSIFGSFFDHGSDIAAAYVLWDEPDSIWWFSLTVTLIVVPTIFVNAFSLYWYCNEDYQASRRMFSNSSRPGFSKCWWVFRIIVHILLLGPIFRYIDLLYYGVKSRKSRLQRINVQGPYCPWPKQQAEMKKQVEYYNLLLHEERDIAILELMHSFMQDAPQLILQLYILAKRPPQSTTGNDYIITVLVQSVSSLSSLMALAWSLTSYQRTLRYAVPDKPQMSVGGSASTFLWHTFQVASRVLALALFANAFKQEVFIALGGHWALMIVWILAQRTNFCGTNDGKRKHCEEFFYNVVVGWMFTFVMINVKAAATRVKYSVYYLLMAAENTTMIVLWFLQPESDNHWYHLPALIGTCVSFVLGLFFMFLYYTRYHPDGKMPKKNESAKLF
ncbi:XK-related protein 7 isoform X1 [Daphnia magna]|uniref:XK-related protein 7 isoform X1 n=1 Tax=Daphnia magna TaxID=35525 RepID=UPI001E1BB1C4|nr:XK-related protein 7 isoform X1 [Daphnia magna]